MKIIFLDIDGVLNCHYSKSRCQGFLGIDQDKVKILKYIINQTTERDNQTKIVLTSTWKMHWDKYVNGTSSEQKFKDKTGKYMREKFRKCGIEIYDYTKETEPLTGAGLRDRGFGIKKWLDMNSDVTSWCVLDDEFFPDFSNYDIEDNLVLTDAYTGITHMDALKAIRLLNITEEDKWRQKGLSYLPCIRDLYDYICNKNIWEQFMSCSLENNKSNDLWKCFEDFITYICNNKK